MNFHLHNEFSSDCWNFNRLMNFHQNIKFHQSDTYSLAWWIYIRVLIFITVINFYLSDKFSSARYSHQIDKISIDHKFSPLYKIFILIMDFNQRDSSLENFNFIFGVELHMWWFFISDTFCYFLMYIKAINKMEVFSWLISYYIKANPKSNIAGLKF